MIPLDKTAFDVGGECLKDWIKWWMGEHFQVALRVEEWYTLGHKPGTHLWAPAPAGALLALEEIANIKLKRPSEVCHVFLCPRLLYFEEWRRRFEKEMDFWILIEPNSSFWPLSCCKPLVLGISYPLRSTPPWKIRRVDPVVELGRTLQEMFKAGDLGAGHILRKFWNNPWVFFGL